MSSLGPLLSPQHRRGHDHFDYSRGLPLTADEKGHLGRKAVAGEMGFSVSPDESSSHWTHITHPVAELFFPPTSALWQCKLQLGSLLHKQRQHQNIFFFQSNPSPPYTCTSSTHGHCWLEMSNSNHFTFWVTHLTDPDHTSPLSQYVHKYINSSSETQAPVFWAKNRLN